MAGSYDFNSILLPEDIKSGLSFRAFDTVNNESISKVDRWNSSLLQVTEDVQRVLFFEDEEVTAVSTRGNPATSFPKSDTRSVDHRSFCYACEKTFQVKEATIVKICSVFSAIQLNEDADGVKAGTTSQSDAREKDKETSVSPTSRWHYPLLDPCRREKETRSTRPAGKLRKFIRKVGLKSSKAKAVKRKRKTKLQVDH